MLPMIPKPLITARQKRTALMVAGAVDLLQIALLPMLLPGLALDEALDVITAIVLVAVCGFKWQFAAAFGLELLPFVGIFPTWTALVLTLPTGTPASQTAANVTAHAVRPEHSGMVDVASVVAPPVQPKALTTADGTPRRDAQVG